MMTKLHVCLVSLVLFMLIAAPAEAAQINFTGGTVKLNSGDTGTTNNSSNFTDVDYYDEAGFRLDFIGGTGFSGNIGDYYAASNDVIHGHWESGGLGGLTMVKVTKLDGSAFDLNYFILTSNTDVGGGTASGNEQVFIHASADGVTSDFSFLLPSESWGFPSTQVYLDSQFDDIKAFWFVTGNEVACFGMDNFYIDEPPPPPNGVPEPSTYVLIGTGIFALALARKARRS
jgi:hypothetical protein